MIIRIRNAYCCKINTTLLIFFSLILFPQINATAQITNYNETERSNAPRQIEPLSNTQHSSDWYKQQAEAWNSEVTSASTNATAWYNYYTAQRFAVYNKESVDISTDGKRKLNNIVDEMETLIPGSFEFNYIKYWNGENDTALFPYLIKAYKINPYRTETYDDLVAFYELTDSVQQKSHFCRKIKNSHVYDTNLYHYAFNLFQSIEPNGILFTYGEWDTYPYWVLQSTQRLRPDITILNLSLLEKRYYFSRKFRDLGIKNADYNLFLSNKEQFFRKLAKDNPKKGLYLGLTVSKPLIRSLADILYTTGLAMKLSVEPFDNVPLVLKNVEQMHLRYINGNKTIRKGSNIALLHANYIAPLLIVYETRSTRKDYEEAKRTKELIFEIAENAEKKEQILQLIK